VCMCVCVCFTYRYRLCLVCDHMHRCVIHYQLPASADTYVHRAGRTARAGAEGLSVALIAPQEAPRWTALNRTMVCTELKPVVCVCLSVSVCVCLCVCVCARVRICRGVLIGGLSYIRSLRRCCCWACVQQLCTGFIALDVAMLRLGMDKTVLTRFLMHV
jgi:hypothetical protein